jgi:MFS family permease
VEISYRVAGFVGAPVGGLLVARSGIRGVMLLDAATFLVAGAVVATALRPRFARRQSTGASIRADLVDGIAYLRRARPVRTLVVALSGLNLFVGPVLAVGLVLRTKGAGWSSSDLGLFEATSAVAAALAALAVLRWKPQRPARTGLLLLVVQAAACVTIGFAPFLGVVLSMATVGATAGLASAFLSAAFQRTVDSAYLGRCSSLIRLADYALMPLATIGFGALAAGADVVTACAITGAAFAALVLWSAFRPGLDVGAADSSRGRRRPGSAAEAARAVGSREPAQM